MTAREREALRAQVSEARRAALISPCPRGFGSETGYRQGCRCGACRVETNAARTARRRSARLSKKQAA